MMTCWTHQQPGWRWSSVSSQNELKKTPKDELIWMISYTLLKFSFSICRCSQEIHAHIISSILYDIHMTSISLFSLWKKRCLQTSSWCSVIIFQLRRDSSTFWHKAHAEKSFSPLSPQIVFDLTLVPKLQSRTLDSVIFLRIFPCQNNNFVAIFWEVLVYSNFNKMEEWENDLDLHQN